MSTDRTTGVESVKGSAYNQAEPCCSRRQLKRRVDRILRSLIHGEAEAIVREIAQELAATPPIFRPDGTAVPDEFGWYFPVGDARDRLYQRLIPVAMARVERVAEEFRLYRRPDYTTWQRWLEKRVRFWANISSCRAEWAVADWMTTIFSERYGVRFAHHYAFSTAVFYIPDATNLGEGWIILRNSFVRGETPADRDYLRVVYAYHPDRQLLLRLHHRHIHMPFGRWVCKWIVSKVWEKVSRQEANIIAGCC